MKPLITYFKGLIFLCSLILIQHCKNQDLDNAGLSSLDPIEENAPFGAVFFAQTHVQQPGDVLFKLISNRATLIKVNFTTHIGESAPEVKAVLNLNGSTETLILSGPSTITEAIDLRYGAVEHKHEDSFTVIIPEAFVQPGLRVTVQAGNETIAFNDLTIGAPNYVIMNMFDAHFFQDSPGDYPNGWLEEIRSKWPVSGVTLRRFPNMLFTELTIPPRKDVGAPASRVSSKADYEALNGIKFDGEQAAASQWKTALKAAAGTRGRYALFYVNIYGVNAGGQAGGCGGVGNGNSLGIFQHEIGHAFSLPHWGDNANYPYKGDMHGISAPDSYNKTHAGPVWAYDINTNTFIPPTVQENAVGGMPGTYKKDPMQGGGAGDQETGFLMRHFSDYSQSKMQNYLEGHIAIRKPGSSDYVRWDDITGTYSKALENNGVNYPIQNDVEVISVMAGVSSTTPQATIVYPPIGPYTSGLIKIFDPHLEADRLEAQAKYCPDGGCDVSLRVVQGGVTKTMLLPIELLSGIDPLDGKSFNTRAVNLPAEDGTVSKIELLSTPDAEINGLPSNPEVLYFWNL